MSPRLRDVERGDRRDPERDAAEQVDRRDPRLERAPRAGEEAAADLDVREVARDEEADRAERIRRPHEPVVAALVEADLHRMERVDVEEHRARELDHAAQPVDAGHLEAEDAEALPAGARGVAVGVDRLQVLQRRRRGEEDRADEVGHAVGGRARRAARSRGTARPGSTPSRSRTARRSTTRPAAAPTTRPRRGARARAATRACAGRATTTRRCCRRAAGR